MKTINVLATGVFYNCGCDKERTQEFLKRIDCERPIFVLTRDEDPNYGTIIRAEEGRVPRATIGRLDIGATLSAMSQKGQDMLTAVVQSVNYEGRNFTLGIDVEDDVEYSLHSEVDWDAWTPLKLPKMNLSEKIRKIKMDINTLTPFLKGKSTLSNEDIINYTKELLAISRCDMARETQEFLGKMRGVLQQSKDKELRELAEDVNHAITGYGSTNRVPEYLDEWDCLYTSDEADNMWDKWYKRSVKKHDNESLRQRYLEQIKEIDDNLDTLPKELCYEYNDKETFLHSLVYYYIPREKLQALMTQLVLRAKLYEKLEEVTEPVEATNTAVEKNIFTPAVNKGEELFYSRLANCFYGDVSLAKEFITAIRPLKPKQITALVKQWVRAKKISDSSYHRELWSLLHDNDYYPRSESNWNDQVG